jgi:capsular exopolysaccharide synthesis family protein
MQLRLANLEAKRIEMLNREADLQGRLQALEKAMRDGRHSRVELLTMIGQGQGANGVRENSNFQATDRLLALKLEEKNLLEDFGPDHPQVRAIRDQLSLLQGRAKFSNSGSDIDPVESHIQALRLEVEYVRMASDSLAKLLLKAHQDAKPMRSLEIQNESYNTELARNKQLFDAIAKRLDEVSILKNANGGYDAETINPPATGAKVAPLAITVFASAILLGLLGGFGMAYLAEVSDHSFRTPEEIRRRLGLPVVGHIPFFPPEAEEDMPAEAPRIDPMLCSVYRPKSRESEAYRGVRTALFFNRGGGHALIQVTSPDMSDGKSTLIGNLAVSIAQAEKKVILIDADFRRPRVHKLFNLSAEKGLASVMTGETELEDVIQASPVPGLSVLPCGPIPPNPAELLTLPRFKEALAYLREKYDYVLVDTPPLLAVTDPCTVVPYVDGVLLTIRLSKNARPSASRAKEILSSLGANVIGVVVNGVGTDSKAYGYAYGAYRYGYGAYRYGYSYSYKQYSNYEENGTSSTPAAGSEERMQEEEATDVPKKQQSVTMSGFLTWLFKR